MQTRCIYRLWQESPVYLDYNPVKFTDSFIHVNDKYQYFIDDNFSGTVNADNGDVGQDIKEDDTNNIDGDDVDLDIDDINIIEFPTVVNSPNVLLPAERQDPVEINVSEEVAVEERRFPERYRQTPKHLDDYICSNIDYCCTLCN